jgi:heptosyltransferase-1
MSDILLIKTSSLGDVIHYMPALSDARRYRPDARFTWVVEEAFAPLVQLHPAVAEIIPVASRRWRGALHRVSTWREIQAFRRTLRARNDDVVIDAQGLIRSGLIAQMAHGRRHGYDRKSVRERPAAWLYQVRHKVDRNLHAIVRNRALTAMALGYSYSGPPDYGLVRRRRAGTRYSVLLHATARPEKEWPEERWVHLGKVIANLGGDVVLPAGNDEERARSERIAAAIPRGRVLDRQPLDVMTNVLGAASFVVGVDTGLLHLAAALGVPLVGIFVGSEPGLTGPVGAGPIAIVGSKAHLPTVDEVVRGVERVVGVWGAR